MRDIFKAIYVGILIFCPIFGWIGLLSMPNYEWDAPRLILMCMITLMGWVGAYILTDMK